MMIGKLSISHLVKRRARVQKVILRRSPTDFVNSFTRRAWLSEGRLAPPLPQPSHTQREEVKPFRIDRIAGEGSLQTRTRHVSRNAGHWEVESDVKEDGAAQLPSQNGSHGNPVAPAALVDRLVHFFLPAGYPDSVSDGYLRYSVLAVGAGVASSAAFVLSTQSMLFAVGLGAGSIPLAAAMNWVIKDGLGQAGGIIFAAWLGRRRGMDADPKKWRTVSAVAMDGATLLEILSPLVPGYFLAVASIANVGKNIAYLSASASRAALNNHFAIQQNLADLTAKAGSQSIFASLAGTALGVAISPIVGSEWTNVAVGFAALSAVHQVCTFMALTSVPLRTLNRERLHHVLSNFLLNSPSSRMSSDRAALPPLLVLDPCAVARLERFSPLLPMHAVLGRPKPFSWVETTSSHIHELLPNGRGDFEAWTRAMSPQASERSVSYFLRCDMTEGGAKCKVHVGFFEHATGEDVLQAFLHAQLVHDGVTASKPTKQVVEEAGVAAKELVPELISGLKKAGWDTNRVFLEPHVIRYKIVSQQQ